VLDAVWLIPAFPLLGFVLLVAFGRLLGEPRAGWLATLMMAGSFVSSVVVYAGLVAEDHHHRFHSLKLFEWVPAGSFSVDVGFLVDPLAITMCLFVTGVGTLIHLYSIGYMHGDRDFHKFFVYLNLFAFSMLMLVLGDNMLLTFLGWEGVGACSYLLISFWFTDEKNSSAGKKAFVTNRVGDFGFMLAMFFSFQAFGSITYLDVFESIEVDGVAVTTATAIAVLLFVGACGKSAQFPLYLWLPDAMAGPTPVSALIHAATMVTSGIYLLTRMNPVLAASSDWVPDLIAWVGVGTALFAATIAVAQNDIKKVLAYSTVSQLGYMFLAVGTGAYVAAIFHMVTHAFFKALLFLGSGSVIHGMHGDQDMRHYGRLMKWMPITGFTFVIGWLAIAGVPPFAGFWSKDEVLAYTYDHNKVMWVLGLITALLTAFYMTRQVMMTFFGRYRYADPRPEEILAARAAAVAAAQTQADGATASVGKAENALHTARAAREAADAEGREAAEAALVAAQQAFADAQAAAASAHNRARAVAQEVAALPAPTVGYLAPPDVTGFEEHLPTAELAHRREYHPHESPWSMTLPLVVLAGLSAVAGGLNLPFAKSLHFLGHWLEPSLFENEAKLVSKGGTLWVLGIIAVVLGLVGIAAAVAVYLRGKADPRAIEKPVLARGWYYDETVSAFMGGPGRASFDETARLDRNVVDGMVNGVAALVRTGAGQLRRLQTGFVRTYAIGIGVGAVLLVGWFLTRASL
jgi:NADH-quinone oxidoreductase subunit L